MAQSRCAPAVVDGCRAWLSEEELGRALLTEGVECGAQVVCRDGVARLRGDTHEGWDLRAMPEAVRSRILALLVSERLTERPAGSEPEAAPSPSRNGSPALPAPPSDEVDAVAPFEAGAPEPAPLEPASEAEPPTSAGGTDDVQPRPAVHEGRVGSRLGSPRRPRRVHPGALWVADEAGPLLGGTGVRYGLGADVFVFFEPATALAGPHLELAYDVFRLDLGVAFSEASGEEGTLAITFAHGTAAVDVVCVRWTDASVCGGAGATLGYVRADPRANVLFRGIAGESVYAGGAVELSAWLATEWVAISLSGRLGWGYGMVALETDGDALAAVGGLFAGARLALAWEPVR